MSSTKKRENDSDAELGEEEEAPKKTTTPNKKAKTESSNSSGEAVFEIGTFPSFFPHPLSFLTTELNLICADRQKAQGNCE